MTTLTTTITKLTSTSDYCPAMGRTFIIELSNGERFKVTTEELINSYCYEEKYDNEKADRMMNNNFQELIGAKY
jgi:hypothetical protein